jgi:cell wall-associated NlpC family hydrolase
MPAARPLLVTRTLIASDALRYRGVPYVWGASGPPSLGWDCSGFVSWVLGHDLGFALPGGWTDYGVTHGPVVSDYIAWGGAVPVDSPGPGDLCCFGPDVHIGIAVSGSQMISALNPSLGTRVGAIEGAAPGQLVFRRVTGAGGGQVPPPARQGSSGLGQVVVRLLLVAGLTAGAVIGVAAAAVFLTSGAGVAAAAAAGRSKTRADGF